MTETPTPEPQTPDPSPSETSSATPSESPSPVEPTTAPPSETVSPSPDTPTQTTTVTQTVQPMMVETTEPAAEPCGTVSQPCVVKPLADTLDPLLVGLALALLLLSAILVASLRRPA